MSYPSVGKEALIRWIEKTGDKDALYAAQQIIADLSAASERVCELEKGCQLEAVWKAAAFAEAKLKEQFRDENARLREALRDIADWKSGFYDTRDNEQAEMLSDNAREALQEARRDSLKKEDHGCSTGDCPHEKQSDCDDALAKDFLKATVQNSNRCQLGLPGRHVYRLGNEICNCGRMHVQGEVAAQDKCIGLDKAHVDGNCPKCSKTGENTHG